MDSGMLNELVGALRVTAAAPVGELRDAEMTEQLVALRRLADAAEAAYLTRLRAFDQRGIAESESVLSTRSWVRHKLHVAPAETSRVLKVAKRLVGLPVVEAALCDGSIRLPHATAIADAATLLGEDVIAGCQDALVEAARRDDPTRLRAALRGLGAAVDDDRAVKRAEKQAERRWLDLSTTFEGALAVDGVLSGADESATVVKTAIDSLAKPVGADDERTPSQRRADALVELCRRHLDSDAAPIQAGEPAQVTVTVDLRTLEERGRTSPVGHTGGMAPDGRGGHEPARGRSGAETAEGRGRGFGELSDGTIIRGETARRLACDAKVTRLIFGPDSQPLDVGRSQRTVTAAQRKALRLRDGGCRFPGCDRPVEWTDAHHVVFWGHGGATDLNNLILLCRKHHTAVHERGWTVQATGPGRFRFVDPNGCLAPDDPVISTSEVLTGLVEDIDDHNGSPRAGPRGAGSTGDGLTRAGPRGAGSTGDGLTRAGPRGAGSAGDGLTRAGPRGAGSTGDGLAQAGHRGAGPMRAEPIPTSVNDDTGGDNHADYPQRCDHADGEPDAA